MLIYLLPGLAAAVSAVTGLVSAQRTTTLTIILTCTFVALSFAVPPSIEWLRARHLRRVADDRRLARRQDDATRRRDEQLRDHFVPRGRGVLPSQVRIGSYFTGRVRVISELTGWFAGSSTDRRPRVVTGAPGSGKSAVLGRLFVLADPKPVAVHARGRTVDEVAVDIAQGIGVAESGAAGLLAALRDGDPRADTSVMVDAVDEAADPYRLIVELLEPLASAANRTKVRLLVGTRRGGDNSLVRLFGPIAVVLDLDDPAYQDQNDVQEYVRLTLLAEHDPQVSTPYRTRPHLARTVARAVAAQAGSSFLVAQITALALTAADSAVDSTDELPDSVSAAMERYLRDVRQGGSWLRDLLMALAWSEGEGFADPKTWAAVATALGTATYSEQDVARLLLDTSAVDLLHRTTRDNRNAYRLFHEALGEHLRQQCHHLLPAEAHRRIAEVLIQGARDAYARTYLPLHAARGQIIDTLLDDAGFLATSEPGRLLVSLLSVRTERGRRIARTIERVGQQLLVAPEEERVCYLEMAAHMAGDTSMAAEMAEFAPDRPWSVEWAHWDALDDGILLGHHDDYVVDVVVVATVDGPVVVSASAWAVKAWRLEDRTPVVCGIHEPHSEVLAMVTFVEGRDAVVLTLHADGEIRRSTLGTTESTNLARGRGSHGLWLIEYASRRAVVTTNSTGNVEILSSGDGRLISSPLITVGKSRILVAENVNSLSLLVTTDYDMVVTVRDLATGVRFGEQLNTVEQLKEGDTPWALWTATLASSEDEVILFCSGWPSSPTMVWNLQRGQLVGEPHFYTCGALCSATYRAEGRDYFCWGDTVGNIHTRSADGTVRRLAAHDNGIASLAVYDNHENTLLISGGRDGAVRVWNLPRSDQKPHENRHSDLVVLPGSEERPSLVAGWATDKTCRVYDARTGELVNQFGANLDRVAPLPGPEPLLFTVDSDTEVVAWHPRGKEPLWAITIPATAGRVLGAASLEDGLALLTGTQDGQMHFLDSASCTPIRKPVHCHEDGFEVAVAPSRDDGRLRFVTWLSHPLTGNARSWSVTGQEATYVDLPLKGEPGEEPISASDVAHGRLGDRFVAAAVSAYSYIFVWDTGDGSLITRTQLERGHGMALNSVEIAEHHGRTVVFSGGYTCSLGLWYPETQEEHHVWVGSQLWQIKSFPDELVVVAGARGMMALRLLPAWRPFRRSAACEP